MKVLDTLERMEADAACEYGHFGCAIDGEEGGPCLDEWFYLVEEYEEGG